MARPSSRPRNPVSEAIIKLRDALGETRQAFANRIEASVVTVARWETSRPPSGKMLCKLAGIALEANRPDLALAFRMAQAGEIATGEDTAGTWAYSPHHISGMFQTAREIFWWDVIHMVLQEPEYAALAPKIARLLKRPAKDYIQAVWSASNVFPMIARYKTIETGEIHYADDIRKGMFYLLAPLLNVYKREFAH